LWRVVIAGSASAVGNFLKRVYNSRLCAPALAIGASALIFREPARVPRRVRALRRHSPIAFSTSFVSGEDTMPIYAYRCDACGHAKDVLQKMSDAPLTDCPACGAPAFKKQLTAAGFQLKGSGWYVTDFRGGSGGTSAAGTSAKTDAAAPASAPAASSESASSAASAAPAASGGCGTSCACH
jgi:putative FmdB family regulatory protein